MPASPRGSVAKARRRLGEGVAQPGRRQIKQCKNKATTVWFPDTHGRRDHGGSDAVKRPQVLITWGSDKEKEKVASRP